MSVSAIGEIRLELVLCDDWHGNTGCPVAQDLALLTKVRTLIHEEISLLTVLYFPFRARTPRCITPQRLSTVSESSRSCSRRPLRPNRFQGSAAHSTLERHCRATGTTWPAPDP